MLVAFAAPGCRAAGGRNRASGGPGCACWTHRAIMPATSGVAGAGAADEGDRVGHGSGVPHYAAEADVRRGGVDRLELPRSRAVAQAVVRRAQVRAALDHAPRDVRTR